MDDLTRELVHYIKYHADAGHSHEKINQHLVKRGHDPHVVNQATIYAKHLSAKQASAAPKQDTSKQPASTQPTTTEQRPGISNRMVLIIVFSVVGFVFLGLALLYAFVFFGVPQLQEDLRDNQRSSDVSLFVTEALSYQAQSNSQLPRDQGELDAMVDAIAYQPVDPSTGQEYEFVFYTGSDAGFDAKADRMLFVTSAICAEGTAVYNDNNRNFAVVTADDSEAGTICRDNS